MPLTITAEQDGPPSVVNDRIVIEMNGIAVKLPAETEASRIAEIVFALEALR